MKLVYGFLFVCLARVASAAEEPSPQMIKTTYCACRCCEKNQAVCFRHPSIPDTYKCSESLCSERFCDIWNKAKCSKSCFCKKCKDKLEKDNLQCAGFRGLLPGCECDYKSVDCSQDSGIPPGIADGIKDKHGKISRVDCVMPCFCKRCRDNLPPAIYDDCLTSEPPADDCNCQTVKCPSDELIGALKTVEEQRKKKKETGKETSFVEEIDSQMTPEKAKKTKCKMQCYCDKCSADNDQLKTTCEGMVPKPRIEDCGCNADDITCPSDDVDSHCKLYCFCKGCMTDSRMGIQMLQGCQKMTEKKQECLCADRENCNVLEKVGKLEKEAKERTEDAQEKSKKGKLKPKKKEKDEL